jgi:hypothetical protein
VWGAVSVHFCACAYWRTKVESGSEQIPLFLEFNSVDPEVRGARVGPGVMPVCHESGALRLARGREYASLCGCRVCLKDVIRTA